MSRNASLMIVLNVITTWQLAKGVVRKSCFPRTVSSDNHRQAGLLAVILLTFMTYAHERNYKYINSRLIESMCVAIESTWAPAWEPWRRPGAHTNWSRLQHTTQDSVFMHLFTSKCRPTSFWPNFVSVMHCHAVTQLNVMFMVPMPFVNMLWWYMTFAKFMIKVHSSIGK